MKTKSTKATDIKRDWHLIDAKGRVLGRLASEVSQLLMGKSKPYFVSHLDCGDFVVVINAKDVKVTGRKEDQKKYTWYSGYPGGLKVRTVAQMREKNSTFLIKNAVRGMLPKNKVSDKLITRLFVYTNERHPHTKVKSNGN